MLKIEATNIALTDLRALPSNCTAGKIRGARRNGGCFATVA
jgi:hypothetical protein